MTATDRHFTHFAAAAFFILMLTFCVRSAEARFLTDDTPPAPQQPNAQQIAAPASRQNAQPQSYDSALPPDAARALSVGFMSGEKNSVQITWDAPATAKDSFIVVRSSNMLNNADAVLNAIPVKIVAPDALKVVLDRNLFSGRYYYAVIPKSKYDQRDIQLFPAENYTTNPVIIAQDSSHGDIRTVASLKAVTVDDRTVLLTWEPIVGFTGEYVIFRSRSPIDVPEKMNSAEPVARMIGAKSRYLDSDAGPGRHYYAVACKTVDGILYSDMKKDFNYIDDPVFVGGIIGVRNIKAEKDGPHVIITWKSAVDTLNKNYYLIRSEIRPTGKDSIAGGLIVDSVQSASEKYTDRNVPAGKYFYLLAPANYKDDEDFTLTRSVNVTDPAIIISSSKNKKDEIPPADMPTNGDTGLPVKADTSAKTDTAPIIIAPANNANAIKNDDIDPIIAGLEEIPSRSSEPGRTGENKAILPLNEKPPVETIPQKDLPITKTPETAQPDSSRDTVIPLPEPARENADAVIPKNENTDTDTVQPQPRRKNTVKPEPDRIIAGDSDIKAAISGLFRNGNYKQTIIELKRALPSAQGREAASARFYIGRSYVELKRYRDALSYLSDEDVMKYFPRESDFWRDYSLEHMK